MSRSAGLSVTVVRIPQSPKVLSSFVIGVGAKGGTVVPTSRQSLRQIPQCLRFLNNVDGPYLSSSCTKVHLLRNATGKIKESLFSDTV